VGVAVGAGHTGFSAGGQMSASGAFVTGGTVGAGGGVAQPAMASAAAMGNAIRCSMAREYSSGMLWVFLEIAVVIAVAIAIVWWTLPKKPK